MCEIIMGQSPSSNNYSSEPCGYILVQGNADIEDGWVTPRVWTTEITKIGKCNDIIMSVRAPAGSVGRTKYDVVLGRGVAAIKGNNFVYRQLEKMEFCRYWKRLASGSTFESLSTAHLKSATIAIPEGREQMMIGNFFELLDHHITVQQRKSVSKDEVMNLFLCKSNALVDIDVYANSWEQRRLGEIFIETSEYVDPEKEALELWSLTAAGGLMPKIERYERGFLVKKNDKFKLLDIGNIAYNPMNITLGSIDLYRGEEPIAVSGYYVTMKISSEYDKTFISTWMKTEEAIKKYKIYATGSLIERQRVQYPTLAEIRMEVPAYNEQQQIGQFFEQLDHYITFQQRM